ncbi:acetyltransferase [Granulicella sibirica]|uniref:Acetyltransferase n=2 Tax=Granulicella sibirica TaxID=2479048 RepID=A0A4Q0T1J1_9BACT|nr:acetyltransferase [Granulicella sibirica]
MAAYTIRKMTVDDAGLVGEQREKMFQAVNKPQDALDAMREPFLKWVAPKLVDGSYLGWAVEHEGKAIGGAGLIVLDWPPHYLHPTDARRGYLLNVYVDGDHRGQGLARKLVEASYEGARELGIHYLVLHASELGRPVYERMGWKDTNEMSLMLVEED